MNIKSLILCLLLTFASFSTFLIVRVDSPSTAVIYVDPPVLYAEENESFIVEIKIANVAELFGWQVNMSFDPDVLFFVNVTKGTFLAEQPNGTDFDVHIVQEEGWALFAETTIGHFPGVYGSGLLATVEFQVLGKGESVLNITHPNTYLVSFVGLSPKEIPSIQEDGFFTNLITPPHAEFTYSPLFPVINESITFNASASYAAAPYNIIAYEWSFGDGTTKNYTGANLTAITTHTYTKRGKYQVVLTVFDDAGMPRVWYELYGSMNLTFEFLFDHNIAVIKVEAHPTIVHAGEKVSIDVTVSNLGMEVETFEVIGYADNDTTVVGDELTTSKQVVTDIAPGDSYNLTLTWDTAGVPEGIYKISAEAIVPAEESPDDNLLIDGTVEVKPSTQSFSPMLIGVLILAVIAVVIGVLLLRKRRWAPSA